MGDAVDEFLYSVLWSGAIGGIDRPNLGFTHSPEELPQVRNEDAAFSQTSEHAPSPMGRSHLSRLWDGGGA
jgi:hypothetical protein